MGGEGGAGGEGNFRFSHGFADRYRTDARFLCAPQHRAGGGDVPDASGQRGVGPAACEQVPRPCCAEKMISLRKPKREWASARGVRII